MSAARQLAAARRLLGHVAGAADLPLTIRLWDGSMIPLGRDAPEGQWLAIDGPGTLGALLRRPSLETLFRLYVTGRVELHGTDLLACAQVARQRKKQASFKALRKGFPWLSTLPLLLARDRPATVGHAVDGTVPAAQRRRRGDQDLIQFHYDASNAFYALFLDPEMVYSCAYFQDWGVSLEEAQVAKLDLICRKLRLKPGERFLDIGCGWGALVCHAAQSYGVRAHGVTLSSAQLELARARIEQRGLADRVEVELRDFRQLDGSYDKIASVGMYEHVGIANYDAYFRKIRGLLAEGGVLLNHGITRRAKRDRARFHKSSPSRRIILKYIFPGAELDHIGHTIEAMEQAGFEVQDVEGLRFHYARTTRLWHDRLMAQRDAAIAEVGPERYRMWLAYLAGVSAAFADGPIRIYQTVATKQASGPPPLPPTRDDIYRMAGPA